MFVGRLDFQVKHMGYRIELPEIEYQVLAIEQIANACVLYNKGKKEITLFYESRDGDLSPAAIRQKLSQVFPKYMLPTVFRQMKELPRNPNGKIDRNGLSARLEQMD
jgi:acyl-coenzyme A synthetase/AMP-(fatty) acid ligase